MLKKSEFKERMRWKQLKQEMAWFKTDNLIVQIFEWVFEAIKYDTMKFTDSNSGRFCGHKKHTGKY